MTRNISGSGWVDENMLTPYVEFLSDTSSITTFSSSFREVGNVSPWLAEGGRVWQKELVLAVHLSGSRWCISPLLRRSSSIACIGCKRRCSDT
eukprot:5782613-Amphidinium_carterae.1